MKMNDAGIALLKEFEGLRLKSYQDSGGVWTIGYGHTSAAGFPAVKKNMVITESQAEEILRRDLAMFEQGVERLLKIPTSSNQFSAMVSLAYNIGIKNFKGSSILRLHNAVDPVMAATRFALWNKAGGRVLDGLIRRRAAESHLYSLPDNMDISQPEPVDAVPEPDYGSPEPIHIPQPSLWQRLWQWIKNMGRWQ